MFKKYLEVILGNDYIKSIFKLMINFILLLASVWSSAKEKKLSKSIVTLRNLGYFPIFFYWHKISDNTNQRNKYSENITSFLKLW